MSPAIKEILESYISQIEKFKKVPPVGAEGQRLEIYNEFSRFLTYYSRILEIAIRQNVSDSLISGIMNYWPPIETYIKELIDLFQGEGGDLAAIYSRVQGFCNSIYSYRNPPIDNQPPFIVYSSLLTGLDSIPYDEDQIRRLKDEYKDKLDKTNALISALSTEVNKLSIEKYARIFKREAEKYSNSKFRLCTKSKEILIFGSSERWLFSGFTWFIVATCVLFSYDLQIDYDRYNFIELVGFGDWLDLAFRISKKAFLVGIFLFFGKYSLKRFIVSKNLYAENIHRHNVLNSFRLLYETSKLDEAKADLMIEVATSIFASSKQPYSESKDGNNIDLSAIIDLLKLTRPVV